jgi:hypothetical protein
VTLGRNDQQRDTVYQPLTKSTFCIPNGALLTHPTVTLGRNDQQRDTVYQPLTKSTFCIPNGALRYANTPYGDFGA